MPETVGRGIVQTQMGCGQGRRRREVGRLAQIRRRELLRGRAQTEWNSVWHSTGHLQTWRQRMGKNYSLCYGLRFPKGVRIIQSLFSYQSFSRLPQRSGCAKWEELFCASRVQEVKLVFCIDYCYKIGRRSVFQGLSRRPKSEQLGQELSGPCR